MQDLHCKFGRQREGGTGLYSGTAFHGDAPDIQCNQCSGVLCGHDYDTGMGGCHCTFCRYSWIRGTVYLFFSKECRDTSYRRVQETTACHERRICNHGGVPWSYGDAVDDVNNLIGWIDGIEPHDYSIDFQSLDYSPSIWRQYEENTQL